MRCIKICIKTCLPILLCFILLSCLSIPVHFVYAADDPQLFDTCTDDGNINKPIVDEGGVGWYIVQYPYGTEAIKVYIPTDSYSVIYGFNHYDYVELQPEECDYQDGWWTIDLSSGNFDCSLDEAWQIGEIDPELCDETAQYYCICTDMSDVNSIVVKIGGEGSPLPVYLTNPDGIIVTIPEYNEPTELKLKTGNNGAVIESDQEIYYTTDGVDPKEASDPTKYTSDETIRFAGNTTILTRTKVGDVWGKLCKFDVYVRPPKPVASIRSGDYSGEQLVELTCAADDSKIYYTTDGTDPTDSSILYDREDTIPISHDTVLKAVAYSGEMSPSEIMTETYSFKMGLSLELIDDNQGSWLAKQKLATDGSAILIAPYQTVSCDMMAGISDAATLKVNGEDVAKGENGKYIFELQTKQVANIVDEVELSKAKNTISVIANGERKDYTVYCVQANCDGLPDKVVDYFCVGSQYTNMIGGFGGNVEGTLVGSSGEFACTSLGNFGGYATWYYKDGIDNAPDNPYGVDFVVIGNSFDGTTEAAEPGNVLVSEDGNKWYTLAGAVHYDSCATWNQKVTYKKSNNPAGKTDYLLDGSEMVTLSNFVYPLKRAYPLHDSLEDFQQFTTFGTFINARDEKNEFNNTVPVYPAFGYADVGYCNNYSNEAENPYGGLFRGSMVGHDYPERILTNRNGDGFDLDWAVNENGEPVTLNRIHYIKIQSATGIINDAIAEKSTEICCMRIAKPADSAVGVTSAPASIKIDGTEVALKSGEVVDATVDGIFDIAVDAPETTNVYINSLRSHTAFMDKAPHGIVRVIVQEGEKEPLIYYFNIDQSAQQTSKKVTAVTFDTGKGLMQDKEKLTCYFDADTIEHLGVDGEVAFPKAVSPKENEGFAYWYNEDNEKHYAAYNADNAAKLNGKTLTAVYGKADDVAAASAVAKAIEALPDADKLTVENDANYVEAAQAAYDDLTPDQKKLISDEDKTKLALATTTIGKLEAEAAAADLQTQLDTVSGQLTTARNRVIELEGAVNDLEGQLTTAQQAVKDAQDKYDTLKAQSDVDKAELAQAKADLDTAKAAEKEAKDNLDAAKADLATAKSKVTELEGKVSALEEDLAAEESEIAELKEKNSILSKTVKKVKAKAKKKSALVSWKSVGKGFKYEVYRSTNPTKSFKKVKTAKKLKVTVKKLKKGKTYYFKVRAFKKVGGKKVYTGYSNIAKVKIKK